MKRMLSIVALSALVVSNAQAANPFAQMLSPRALASVAKDKVVAGAQFVKGKVSNGAQVAWQAMPSKAAVKAAALNAKDASVSYVKTHRKTVAAVAVVGAATGLAYKQGYFAKAANWVKAKAAKANVLPF